MSHQEPRPDFFSAAAEKDGLKIDYRRILYRALRYWYYIALSLLVAYAIAYVRNRYARKVYPVNASILIKESKETGSGGEILYNNPLIAPYRNYYNELYIIKSHPLIQSVLEDLNFGISFFREGNILTSELYDFPITATILNAEEIKSCSFSFMLKDSARFELGPLPESGDPTLFSVADTILYKNVKMVFRMKPNAEFTDDIDKSVVFRYTAPERMAGAYVGRLNANWAQEGAGVINLNISGLNPQKEIDFLNGFIHRYQQYDLENKNQAAERTVNFISNQLSDIRDSLRQVENVLQRFKGQNIVTDLGEETRRLYEQMEVVDLERTEIIFRENYYKYLTEYLSQDSKLDQVIMPSSVGLEDPVLAGFIGEMINIQLDLKTTLTKERLDNPLIRQKKERLEEIKKNIIESVRNQRATDKIRLQFLDSRIKGIQQHLSSYPAAEREFVAIQRNYALLENLYVYLLQKRAEASISQAASVSDIVVVNPPMAGGPISPKPTQNYVVAGITALALPLAIFILLELFNTRIQSKDDIEKFTSVPFIGGVGHKTSMDNRAVLESPKSAVAESFRALRSNLAYFLGDKKNVVVLITSSISGEGKTFTSINLATVLALSGKKTLILGADMRKPKLFTDFRLTNDVGLSSFLVGAKTFDEVVQKTSEANMDLVSGGPVPPNPSELVLNAHMKAFFDEARKRYDYIIVDSPPLAIVADAFVLNDHADHLIFVTRQDYTPKQLLKSLDEHYRNGRLKNMSLLLNDIFKSGPGYGYGYSYGYGYGYGYVYGNRKKNGHGYYQD